MNNSKYLRPLTDVNSLSLLKSSLLKTLPGESSSSGWPTLKSHLWDLFSESTLNLFLWDLFVNSNPKIWWATFLVAEHFYVIIEFWWCDSESLLTKTKVAQIVSQWEFQTRKVYKEWKIGGSKWLVFFHFYLIASQGGFLEQSQSPVKQTQWNITLL